MPTFTVDGAVAGAWKWDRDRIELDWFARPTKAVRAEVDAEAERLATLHQ